jgi:ligand-binding sensor domain-containing protein
LLAAARETNLARQFVHIGESLGLPGRTVRAIAEDPQGLLWLGIEYHGLCRYDGESFIVYAHDPARPDGLPSNVIDALHFDPGGVLWVGTEDGLARFEPARERWKVFRAEGGKAESLPGPLVRAIQRDREGHLWVGTSGGLARLDEERDAFIVLPFRREGELRFPAVNALHEDADGVLWIGTGEGVFRREPGGDEARWVPSPPGPTVFQAVTADEAGNLWWGTDEGVWVRDRTRGQFERNDAIEAGMPVYCVMADRAGGIWVGGLHHGLARVDARTGRAERFRTDARFEHNFATSAIRALYEDRRGYLWISSKMEGLYLHNPASQRFEHYVGSPFLAAGFAATYVESMAIDAAGALWIGTMNAGLFRRDPATGGYERLRLRRQGEQRLADVRILDIAIASDGFIWLGLETGHARVDPRSREIVEYPGDGVLDLIEYPAGRIALGTSKGLRFFDPVTERFRDPPAGDGIDLSVRGLVEIQTLFVDREGMLWIGTHHRGLYRYDHENDEVVAQRPGAAREAWMEQVKIRALWEDPAGDLWIGTKKHGLLRYDRAAGTLRAYSSARDLPVETIPAPIDAAYSLLPDQEGRLWVTTNRGICRLDPETGEADFFGPDYGLQSTYFLPNAACVDEAGRLYFGGYNGYNVIDPRLIALAKPSPTVLLTSVEVGSRQRWLDPRGVERIELGPDENALKITYAVLNFSHPGRNAYEYRLLGVDEDWVRAGGRHFVNYTALAPGTYTFEVRARRAESPREEAIAAVPLTIVVRPPFLASPAFRRGLGAFVGAVFLGGNLAFWRAQRRRRRLLDRRVREKREELRRAVGTLDEQRERIARQTAELETLNRRLDGERETLLDTIGTRTAELAETTRRAEEADRLKSAFLANISHELRTPLNAILGYSHLLDGGVDEGEFGGMAQEIRRNTALLGHLADDILDVTAMEAGRLVCSARPIPLTAFLADLRETFTEFVRAEGQPEHRFELTDERPARAAEVLLESDPARIRQILTHLVSNACKYTEGGRIALRCSLDPLHRQVQFRVEDQGEGIAAEDRAVIFDRFRKVRDMRNRYIQGTGLGLAISRDLAHLLGGRLDLDERAARGAAFCLRLPLRVASKGGPA